MYGNVVKISTDSDYTIGLCELEVYADAYGKSQRNGPLSHIINGVFQGSQMEYEMSRNNIHKDINLSKGNS